MAQTVEKKKEIIEKFKIHETDTGSTEVQVAVLSKRLDELAAHLKKNPKDNHSRRGLLGIDSRQRRLDRAEDNHPNGLR